METLSSFSQELLEAIGVPSLMRPYLDLGAIWGAKIPRYGRRRFTSAGELPEYRKKEYFYTIIQLLGRFPVML